MSLYIVTIHLGEDSSMSFCQDLLRNTGDIAVLMDGVFLLRTTLKATDVRDFIRERIAPERCFVSKLSHGAAWNNVLVPNSVIKEWYGTIEF